MSNSNERTDDEKIAVSQDAEELEAALAAISQAAYERMCTNGFDFSYSPSYFVEPLRNLLRDNSSKNAEELRSMAIAIAPGSVHNNCMLLDLAMSRISALCPRLKAAVFALTWGGGKFGFQHMPDPRTVSAEEYDAEGDILLDNISGVQPIDILVGEDRQFYDSLPEQFLIYRGCYGVSPRIASRGVCWTTRRDIAEWFATRGISDQDIPVLLSARIRKRDVLLAFASEHEIVLKPERWRVLRCQRRKTDKRRPFFDWLPPVDLVFTIKSG